MKYYILAIRDIKANVYDAPLFVANINAAIRDLTDMVNDKEPQRTWQRHPEDFELWQLGEWDNENAGFAATDAERKQLLALSTLSNKG